MPAADNVQVRPLLEAPGVGARCLQEPPCAPPSPPPSRQGNLRGGRSQGLSPEHFTAPLTATPPTDTGLEGTVCALECPLPLPRLELAALSTIRPVRSFQMHYHSEPGPILDAESGDKDAPHPRGAGPRGRQAGGCLPWREGWGWGGKQGTEGREAQPVEPWTPLPGRPG